MNRRRRIHGGIVGAIILARVALGFYDDPLWLWLPVVLGLILLQSATIGFCPVYYLLDKTCPAYR